MWREHRTESDIFSDCRDIPLRRKTINIPVLGQILQDFCVELHFNIVFGFINKNTFFLETNYCQTESLECVAHNFFSQFTLSLLEDRVAVQFSVQFNQVEVFPYKRQSLLKNISPSWLEN